MRSADLAERIDTMKHRMDSMEQRLDASFSALTAEILQSRRQNDVAHSAIHARFESVETAIDDSQAHLEAAIADLLGAIKEGDEGLGSALRGEMKAMDANSRTEAAGHFSAMGARMDKLETSLANGLEDNRRFMLVLHEQVMSQFKLLGEGRPSSS